MCQAGMILRKKFLFFRGGIENFVFRGILKEFINLIKGV
jgi:hypothetical protein